LFICHLLSPMRIEKPARVAIIGGALSGQGGRREEASGPPLRRLGSPHQSHSTKCYLRRLGFVGDRYHRPAYLLALALLHGSQPVLECLPLVLARVLVNGTYVELREPQYAAGKEHARERLEQYSEWWRTPLAERRERTSDLSIELVFFRIDIASMSGLRGIPD
jgi:hypothetical protein